MKNIFLPPLFLLLSLMLLVMCMSSERVEAQQFGELYVGAWSKHKTRFDSRGEKYNERHDLVAWAPASRPVIVGYFKNSYGDDSGFLAYRLKTKELNNFIRMRASIGAVYGYRKCYGYDDREKRFCLGLIPEVEIGRGRIKPAILYFGGAVAISAKVSF